MALSKLQSAVLYTTILIALKYVVYHEITRREANPKLWEDPVWKNLTNAVGTIEALKGTTDNRPGPRNTNITISNGTLLVNSTAPHMGFHALNENYYRELPRDIFLYALLVPLQYYWNIGLERLFPTRARAVEVSYEPGKKEKSFDDNEDRDEEVVMRWMAQGRVRRSSVSWMNTFFKWVLHLTVGKLVYEVVFHLVEGVVKWQGLSATLAGLKSSILTCWAMSILSIGPLASLIGFIVVPAHQRVLFSAGVDLVETAFWALFWRVFLPWIINQKYVRTQMADTTATIFKGAQKMEDHAKRLHMIDEL